MSTCLPGSPAPAGASIGTVVLWRVVLLLGLLLLIVRKQRRLSPAAWTKHRAPGIVAIAELGACSSALASSVAGGAAAPFQT